MSNHKTKYNWDSFVLWCEVNGVDLEYAEDYVAWWDCWKSAIDAHDVTGQS